jgi:hypothetical protein
MVLGVLLNHFLLFGFFPFVARKATSNTTYYCTGSSAIWASSRTN